MSISLHAATQARRLLAVTASGLPSTTLEIHPMDHDSDSSGHTRYKTLTPLPLSLLDLAGLREKC